MENHVKLRGSQVVVKANRYTILIVILSVLLAISLIVGSTYAWFTSSDTASRTIVLGDPVELNIVDANYNIVDGDQYTLPIVISGNRLLPGMQINMLARVLFTQSNTPALLRARLTITVDNTQADVSALEEDLNDAVTNAIDTTTYQKWVYNPADGWWYYLGVNEIQNTVTHSMMERIVCTGTSDASRSVTFMNDSFNFPHNVGNDFSNAEIIFSLEFQAVQGYLPAYDEIENIGKNEYIEGSPTGFRLNTIANVSDVFDEAFSV